MGHIRKQTKNVWKTGQKLRKHNKNSGRKLRKLNENSQKTLENQSENRVKTRKKHSVDLLRKQCATIRKQIENIKKTGKKLTPTTTENKQKTEGKQSENTFFDAETGTALAFGVSTASVWSPPLLCFLGCFEDDAVASGFFCGWVRQEGGGFRRIEGAV